MAWLVLVVILIVSYLVGSINGAVIVSTANGGKDVRNEGSGNAGMTNMIRSRGIVPGLITFLIDTFKGTVICFAAKLWVLPYVYSSLGFSFLRPEYAVYYCAVACIFGHVYPIFFGFKGGKGVATTLGVGFACCWQTALAAFALFLIIFAVSRIVSLGSIAAAVSLPILNFVFALFDRVDGAKYDVLIKVILILVMSLNMIISHRANIGRLIRGEEKKLVAKRKES
ncbi:MAG: glycerol-3-phosphate 1-O-acyltransferase PlsY [Clostridia bacterium]|nr:glycerol-3-phosphate 1-O-acyltransferase PlsY [Clostridia bacterium]